MPSKTFDIDDIGQVRVVKSKRSRNLRISIRPDGIVRVSTPSWISYGHALDFVVSRKHWIQKNQDKLEVLSDGDRIGKAHRIVTIPASVRRPNTRIIDNRIVMKHPYAAEVSSNPIQKLLLKKSIEALTIEASALLPNRLANLARENGFSYKSVQIKTLRSRWGSCNSQNEITLSCFLMQLSWKEIDYVIIHELAHTQVMAHDKDFWKIVADVIPDVKEVKRELRTKKPQVVGQKFQAMA